MITILIILLIVLVLINIYLTLKKGENVRDEELEERLIKTGFLACLDRSAARVDMPSVRHQAKKRFRREA